MAWIQQKPNLYVNDGGWYLLFDSADGWTIGHDELDVELPLHDLLNNPGTDLEFIRVDPQTGKMPVALLPGNAINDSFVVQDETARLALSASRGDIAVEQATNTSWILAGDNPHDPAQWLELLMRGVDDVARAQIQGFLTGANQANGFVVLDVNGQIPSSLIPVVSLQRVYTTTQTDPAQIPVLFSTALLGSIVILGDGTSWIRASAQNGDLSDWILLSTMADSVARQQIAVETTARISGDANLQTLVNALNAAVATLQARGAGGMAGNFRWHMPHKVGAKTITQMQQAGWVIQDGTTVESQLVTPGYFTLADLAIVGATDNMLNPYPGRGGLFVRGGAVSGQMQQDSVQSMKFPYSYKTYYTGGYGELPLGSGTWGWTTVSGYTGSAVDDGNGTPRLSLETRAANISAIPMIYVLK